MDRDWAVGTNGAERERPDRAGSFVLPSRAAALEIGRAALESSIGPLLITGEAGTGKTWLWQRLADNRPASRRVLAIDLTPATDPGSLFRAIGHGLGCAASKLAGEGRLGLADQLIEASADGRRWILVIDEVHTAADTVLEEARILSNRLGLPDGFWGLVLVGQTGLTRRLAIQPLLGLETRLAAHIHLRPIDADEATALLQHRWPGRAWSVAEVERYHRDAAGNPKRLLRLAARAATSGDGPVRFREVEAPRAGMNGASITSMRSEAPTLVSPLIAASNEASAEVSARAGSPVAPPLLGPARPPIREEEGLIEVGWEPAAADRPAAPSANGSGRTEEAVEDHYAALQAWNEWAQSQGRSSSSPPPPPPQSVTTTPPLPLTPAEPVPSDLIETAEEPEPEGAEAEEGTGHVWVEGPDRFAPYSQLFSRLRPSKEAD